MALRRSESRIEKLVILLVILVAGGVLLLGWPDVDSRRNIPLRRLRLFSRLGNLRLIRPMGWRWGRTGRYLWQIPGMTVLLLHPRGSQKAEAFGGTGRRRVNFLSLMEWPLTARGISW